MASPAKGRWISTNRARKILLNGVPSEIAAAKPNAAQQYLKWCGHNEFLVATAIDIETRTTVKLRSRDWSEFRWFEEASLYSASAANRVRLHRMQPCFLEVESKLEAIGMTSVTKRYGGMRMR